MLKCTIFMKDMANFERINVSSGTHASDRRLFIDVHRLTQSSACSIVPLTLIVWDYRLSTRR